MDPTANLKEQLHIAARVRAGLAASYEVDRLAELVEALDEWICKGGFLPKQWKGR